jgi:hypothetical protein
VTPTEEPIAAAPQYTPVPTVPPRTPTPAKAAPIPTRPIKSAEAEQAKKAGKEVGPKVTFAGIARADGHRKEPESIGKDGIPVYESVVGSGFLLVVEGKPGISNLEVGRRLFVHDPKDPKARPDVEIQVDRDLADGSAAVCDRMRPNIGGIPGINPPSFAETQKIADALNDLSCRFETFIERASACTVNRFGDFDYLGEDSTIQFCMIVARAWRFPIGDTLVSVRLRDSEGNPGPVAKFRLRRPKERPRPTQPKLVPTPTPPRRRP